MKKVTIKVADSKPDHIPQKEYDLAKRVGPMLVNAVTALENVRRGNGLYQIEPEKPKEDATINFNGLAVEDMGRSQLFTAAMTLGVTIKNKSVSTAKLREMVSAKFQAFIEGNAGEDEDQDKE